MTKEELSDKEKLANLEEMILWIETAPVSFNLRLFTRSPDREWDFCLSPFFEEEIESMKSKILLLMKEKVEGMKRKMS